MVTKADCVNAQYGEEFHHVSKKNADGSPMRVRVSGKCITWKRQPNEFKLPIKHGLYSSGYITEYNAREWEKGDGRDYKKNPVYRVKTYGGKTRTVRTTKKGKLREFPYDIRKVKSKTRLKKNPSRGFGSLRKIHLAARKRGSTRTIISQDRKKTAHRFAKVTGFLVQVERDNKWITLGSFPEKRAAVDYGQSLQRRYPTKRIRVYWD